MGLLIFGVVASTTYLLLMIGMSGGKDGAKNVAWWSVAAAVFSLCALTPTILLQAALTFAVAVVCCYRGLPRRRLVQGALGSMAVAYSVTAVMIVVAIGKNHKLKEQYPLISVADRLAHERNAQAWQDLDVQPVLSAKVSGRLYTLDDESGDARTTRLAMLHSASATAFIRESGFGPVRGYRMPRLEQIELPAMTPVPLPLEMPRDPSAHDSGLAQSKEFLPPPDEPRLLLLHDAGLDDLFAPQRLGWVNEQRQAAGFIPHQFTAVPRLSTLPNSECWQLVRLQLVGLLRHPEPVVYVTEHLPIMDKIETFPTRPLTPFEQRALDKLRTQEDLVIDDTQAGTVQMVGSLRAAKSCLQCHSVPHGALLGALTYELRSASGQGVPKPRRQTEL